MRVQRRGERRDVALQGALQGEAGGGGGPVLSPACVRMSVAVGASSTICGDASSARRRWRSATGLQRLRLFHATGDANMYKSTPGVPTLQPARARFDCSVRTRGRPRVTEGHGAMGMAWAGMTCVVLCASVYGQCVSGGVRFWCFGQSKYENEMGKMAQETTV